MQAESKAMAVGDLIMYPVTPPIAEIQLLANVLFRKVPAELKITAKCGAITQLYLMGLLIGEPQGTDMKALSRPMAEAVVEAKIEPCPLLSDREAAELLYVLSGQAQTQNVLGGIGTAVMIRLAKALLPYLINWLSEYLLSDNGLKDLVEKIQGQATATSVGTGCNQSR